MPDLGQLFRKWWKQTLAVVLLASAVTGTISFLKRPQYLSVATSVPASSFATDRGKIFNENIELLYSSLGTADDLDMILGTAQLDTVYLAVTDKFNLFDHYKMGEKGEAARKKAASLLKGNSKVMRSGYGELKVKVWDTDKNLAPQMANAIMEQLQVMHQAIQNAGNKRTLDGLKATREKIVAESDSIRLFLASATMPAGENDPYTTRLNALTTQLTRTEKLIIEYEMLYETGSAVLIPVEMAKPGEYPDRPKKMKTIIATAVLAFLFSLFAILLLESRKNRSIERYTS